MALTITAIVCAYNEVKYLPGCLHSLLAQTRPPDEILVINNASTAEAFVLVEDAAALREELAGHCAGAALERGRRYDPLPQRLVGGLSAGGRWTAATGHFT